MKKPYHLIILGGLAGLAGAAGASLSDLSGMASSSPERSVSIGMARGEDRDDDIAALRQEFARLAAALDSRTPKSLGSDGLRDDLLSLKKEVAALRDLVANSAPANGNDDDASLESDLPAYLPEDMALIKEQQDYELSQRWKVIDDDFQAEPVDPSWSFETADRIQAMLDHEQLAQSEIYGLDCRSSICRLEVSHADSIAAQKFNLHVSLGLAGVLPRIDFFQDRRDDGSELTVMYLARDGYDPARL